MIAAPFDINIALDVFLGREPWLAESAAVLAANQRGEIRGHLSAVPNSQQCPDSYNPTVTNYRCRRGC
jgi:hypothetical protein